MNYPHEKQIIGSEENGLSFKGNGVNWNTADDVKNVVDALGGQNAVHYLKLSGNALGVSAAAAIGKAIEKHPEFCKALWQDIFNDPLTAEVPLALKYLSQGLIKAKAQLTVLDLSDNSLGIFGMTGLEEFLWSPVCYTLQELYLNNCGLGLLGSRLLSASVRKCLENSIKNGTPLQLKVFVAGGNCLENEGAKAISEMLRDLRTLEVIALPKNLIHQPGIEMLTKSVSCNRNLRILNLSNNIITSKGASHLAKAISGTLLLQELDLSDCKLTTDGAISIAKVLGEKHLHLETVNLSFNEINKNGGLVIAAAMNKKPNLKKLMLNGNNFGSDGFNIIAKEMQSAVNPGALSDMPDNQSECGDNDEINTYDAASICDGDMNGFDIATDSYGNAATGSACVIAGLSDADNGAASDSKDKAIKG